MGAYECDDGNTHNGDGCDSQCKIEKEFICDGGNATAPDKCRDISPPKLVISHSRYKNSLKYYFALSKPVQILSSEDAKTFVEMSIVGNYNEYDFDHKIQFRKLKKTNNNISQNNRILGSGKTDFYNQIIVQLIPLSSIFENDVNKLNINLGTENII